MPDGASISISGFGLSSGVPNSLLAAAVDRGSASLKDLCLVANGVGGAAAQLIENHQVSRLIVSFVSRPRVESAAGAQGRPRRIDIRDRPAGHPGRAVAGRRRRLAGIYTPTGVGTPIAEGKEVRFFDGKPFLFEPAIKVDYAFVTRLSRRSTGQLRIPRQLPALQPELCQGRPSRHRRGRRDRRAGRDRPAPHRICRQLRRARRQTHGRSPTSAASAAFAAHLTSPRTYNDKPAWTRAPDGRKRRRAAARA